MSFSFKFYADSGLLSERTQGSSRQLSDGSSPANENDQIVYLGSTETGKKARATSNPGTDPIEVAPVYAVDAWAAGSIALNQEMRPTVNNNYKYRAENTGTAVTEPTWPTTIGATVVVDGITYRCIDELHQPEEVTLAASAAELDTNTPGAALSLGTEILSGVGNATPVYVRIDQDAHPVGTYTDLQLLLTELDEEDV